MQTVAPLRTSVLVAALALTMGACQRNAPPPTPPAAPASDGNTPRYAAQATPVTQAIALSLTHTRLGLYVEATLEATATLTVSAKGDALRNAWAIQEVAALEVDGTLEAGELDKIRALVDESQGVAITDLHGLVDPTATDADPTNVARHEAVARGPVAAGLVMHVLAAHLSLPRVPASDLKLDAPAEIEEESETALGGETDLVMPTTTVYRYTLRGIETIDGARVAEIEVVIASVAQPDLEVDNPDAENPEPPPEDAEPAAELKSESNGTLMFDLDHGVPVSLELTHTESIRVGEQESEQSVQVRSTYTRT